MTRCAARPAIGVLCCNETVDRPVQVVATRFVQPLAQISDALVFLIPAMIDTCDVAGFVARLDGLLLTGSRSNVAPARYGGEAPGTPLDEARDEVALSLAGRMIDAGRPVFGICRGLQEINVLFGGTLTDGLVPGAHHRPGDEAYEDLFGHRHDVTLVEDGCLAAATGQRRLAVNSVHHQGIGRLGGGLVAEAHADDGLIEAVAARPCGADVLAVQWHPEWDVARCSASRSFFTLIGDALRGHAIAG